MPRSRKSAPGARPPPSKASVKSSVAGSLFDCPSRARAASGDDAMELWRLAHQPLTWEPTEPWEEHVAESYKTILIEREAEGVTFVILNRPEKRNAMSPELHREMCDA